MAIRLRPYQRDAIERLASMRADGVRRVVLVAPVGAGKTTIAAQIILDEVGRGGRVIFVAHRRELISQAYDRLLTMGLPRGLLGVIMASDRRANRHAPVQVASVATLVRRDHPPAEMIIVDECHRATSTSYRRIAESYPDAVHMGLTATPYRANGDGLGDAYDAILEVASVRELIDAEHLVEPRIWTVPPDHMPDLHGVKVSRGDYAQGALGEVMDSGVLVGSIVEHWRRHAGGTRTVVFATTVEHSESIAARFREAGVAAEHVDGTTPPMQREASLARLEAGETRVISNVGLFGEGWDMPSVGCVILARPTKSLGLYLQQVGRVMRPYEGEPAVVLDHAGNVQRHGFPADKREFTLAKRPKLRGAQPDMAKACPSCQAMVHLSVRVCPMCGAQLVEEREVAESDGELVEVVPPTESEKAAALAKLWHVAARRSLSPAWVSHRYRERFGEPVPSRARDERQRVARVLREERGRVSWELFDG